MRQHLAAVRAAAMIGNARVSAAEIGSRELTFRPGVTCAGEYRIAIGTAGSATLVFQTLFPALALAKARSVLAFEGGTHNPGAPTFDFLARVFLPLVARMGPRCTAVLERPGFYPAGGGRFRAQIEPAAGFGRLDLPERGEIRARRATATVARLSRTIGERELEQVRRRLSWNADWLAVETVRDAVGPGNVVCIEIESEHVTELFTAFGEKGVPAERVGAAVADEAAEYLAARVPVGRHLADQLVLPMALGGGGLFRTVEPSRHTLTHVELLQAFLGTVIHVGEVRERAGAWEVQVPARH
jgi:RNA 3'-terminal phosphate cyclase (ATP)